MAPDKTGVTEKTVATAKVKKICAENFPLFYAKGVQKMPIFIPMDITEDVVNLVAQKPSDNSGPGGTDSEDLQRWILKFREDIKKLRIHVEMFVEWIANNNPPWQVYFAFMSARLITPNKQPGVHHVGVRETWIYLFVKCVLKVTVIEAINACQDD